MHDSYLEEIMFDLNKTISQKKMYTPLKGDWKWN